MLPCPSYLGLSSRAQWQERISSLRQLLAPCRLCPRECGADRVSGGQGFCRSGDAALVASYGPHFGEERPLVGRGGSGTIFLAGCNLGCVFCQNSDISHGRRGSPVSPAELAGMMLELQEMGCHNINFVTPTHFAPQIVEGVGLAAAKGLRLPLVWNCGGYESLEVLALLDGIVDIYMPDAKYSDPAIGLALSGAVDYPARMMAAVAAMHGQVGDLTLDAAGVARRGLLVRHLVLPQGLAGTPAVVAFLAGLSRNTYVNVMAQYRPCYRAGERPELSRRPSAGEYQAAVQAAARAGLTRLDTRP